MDSETAEDWEVHVLTQARRNEIHCTAYVNAESMRLKIDTGAKSSRWTSSAKSERMK